MSRNRRIPDDASPAAAGPVGLGHGLAYHRRVQDANEDPRSPGTGKPLAWPLRAALVILGALSLAIGVIGLFVPGLPTTVFVLIAAACAARGSPRFHRWLLAHRVFGAIIRDWQDGGRVSRPAKRAATVSMVLCALILALVASRGWALVGIAVMAIVLAWLWRRPET